MEWGNSNPRIAGSTLTGEKTVEKDAKHGGEFERSADSFYKGVLGEGAKQKLASPNPRLKEGGTGKFGHVSTEFKRDYVELGKKVPGMD